MNKKIIIAFFVGITIASVPWYFHSKKIEHQLDLMYLGLINPDGTIKSTKDSISFESILADEAIKNNKIIKSESKGLIDNMLETTDNFIRHKNFDKLIGEKVPEFEYADRNGKLFYSNRTKKGATPTDRRGYPGFHETCSRIRNRD